MTNYNLEEFKAWLEENPARKENLPDWTKLLTEFTTNSRNFQSFMRVKTTKKTTQNNSTSGIYPPYRQIVLKWKAEVDEKEKEQIRREKELSERQAKINELEGKLTNTLKSLQDLQRENQTLKDQAETKKQRILALEADKQDLIQQLNQTKQKQQTYLSQEKAFLQREIQLIKEALHD